MNKKPQSAKNSETGSLEYIRHQDAYQAIVDAIPDMIIRLDRNGTFRSFEGAVEELYWPADAYLGKALQAVLPA